MQSSSFRFYTRLLNNRLPLIRFVLNWWGADALQHQRSPAALWQLAMASANLPPGPALDIARSAVAQLPGPGETPPPQNIIDAICDAWARTRHPWLAGQVVQRQWVAAGPPPVRVLTALLVDQTQRLARGGAGLVPPLLQACQDPDPELRQRAWNTLHKLTNPQAINAVCAQWQQGRPDFLNNVLRRAGYIATAPPELRVATALHVAHPEALAGDGPEIVPALAQAALRSPAAQGMLAGLKDPAARDAVCQLVIEPPVPTLGPVALAASQKGGYLPSDERQRALFLFITQQWEAYDSLDFERRLLRTAYEAASPGVRNRVLDGLRLSGRTDFLTVLAGHDYRARLAQLTPPEATFLVRMLADKHEWPRLWSALFDLPLPAALHALQALHGSAWRPAEGEAAALLDELAALAQAPLAALRADEQRLEHLVRQLPPAVLGAQVQARGGRINALAFSPQNAGIALGSSGRRVGLWNFQAAAWDRRLGPYDHSIGLVAFTRQGDLLFAERTNSLSATCRLYYCPAGGVPQSIWKSSGSVTALAACPSSVNSAALAAAPVREAAPDWALAAGRSGEVQLISTTNGATTISTTQMTGPQNWIRAAAVSSDGHWAALLHRGLVLARLPDLSSGANLVLPGQQDVFRCAAFLPPAENHDFPGLVLGKYDGQVLFLEGPQLQTGQRLHVHAGRVQAVEMVLRRNLLVTASAAGGVQFSHLEGWKNRGAVRVPTENLTSLTISPDGDFMAVGEAEARFSLWDLRALDVPELFTRPLAACTPHHLKAVRLFTQDSSLAPELKASLHLLERMLEERFRYDIELSDVAEIRFGEYDIEIA